MSGFNKFLADHRGGVFHDELCEALQSLVASVSDERKGGSLTIKISIKPGDAKGSHLVVSDEIKTTLPKPSKSTSIFYASPENNLVRDDPRQTKMELREIGAPASAARSLA